jgi:ABC-type lipoprotein release transport system permease subunit
MRGVIIATAIIAAIYPSIKTIKLRPAEAIRTY